MPRRGAFVEPRRSASREVADIAVFVDGGVVVESGHSVELFGTPCHAHASILSKVL